MDGRSTRLGQVRAGRVGPAGDGCARLPRIRAEGGDVSRSAELPEWLPQRYFNPGWERSFPANALTPYQRFPGETLIRSRRKSWRSSSQRFNRAAPKTQITWTCIPVLAWPTP